MKGNTIENRIQYLNSRCEYFEKLSTEKLLFLPEYETCKAILSIIKDIDKTQEEKLFDIVALNNGITKVDHYNRSGWLDFQMALLDYFRYYDYSIEFNTETGLMRVL